MCNYRADTDTRLYRRSEVRLAHASHIFHLSNYNFKSAEKNGSFVGCLFSSVVFVVVVFFSALQFARIGASILSAVTFGIDD